MARYYQLLTALLCAAMLGSTAVPALCAPGDAAGAYLDGLTSCLRAAQESLPHVSSVAEAVAARLVAGGKLWLAGSYEGFIIEAFYRAGGMMNATRLKSAEELRAGDVVLLGAIAAADPNDIELLQAAADRKALVVVLAPENPAGEHLYISTHVAGGAVVSGVPMVSSALTMNLWAFTGELVCALTRLGKMPPMFQSVVVPGGRERNKDHLGLAWEPTSVPPVPAGELGGQYLSRLLTCLQRMRETQMALFGQAGVLAKETVATGHTVWYVGVGHQPPYEVGQAGDPDLTRELSVNAEPGEATEKVKPGDCVWYVGYYEPFGPWVETVHQAGGKIVTVLSGTPERPASEMGADINIDGCWPYGDALVDVPGYDVRILPPSGAVQSAAYWMLVAEMAAEQ